MAALLTGAGDISHSNSGASTTNGSGVPIPLPSNTAAGDVLLLVVRTGRTATGLVFTTPSGWTKLADTHYNSTTTAIDGAVFYRAATAGDAGGSVTLVCNVAQRRAVTIIRTTGLDPVALANASLTPTEQYPSGVGISSVTCPAVTPASSPGLLLHLVTLNVPSPTASPGGGATFSGDTAGPVLNDGFTSGMTAVTNLLLASRDTAGIGPTATSTVAFDNGNNTASNRYMTASLALPALAAPTGSTAGTSTSSGGSAVVGSTAAAGATSSAPTATGTTASAGVSAATVRLVGGTATTGVVAGQVATVGATSGVGATVGVVLLGGATASGSSVGATVGVIGGTAATGATTGQVATAGATLATGATSVAVSLGGSTSSSSNAVASVAVLGATATTGATAGVATAPTPGVAVDVTLSIVGTVGGWSDVAAGASWSVAGSDRWRVGR